MTKMSNDNRGQALEDLARAERNLRFGRTRSALSLRAGRHPLRERRRCTLHLALLSARISNEQGRRGRVRLGLARCARLRHDRRERDGGCSALLQAVRELVHEQLLSLGVVRAIRSLAEEDVLAKRKGVS